MFYFQCWRYFMDNKEELLAKAKIDYCMGVVFNNGNLGINDMQVINIGECYFDSNRSGDILVVSKLGNSWTIYRDNNWATIISSPIIKQNYYFY